MKTTILTAIFLVSGALTLFAQENEMKPLIDRPADIGLIYPISTNGVFAAQYNNKLSLQAIAGLSGGVTGSAFAGIANIVKQDVRGSIFAGILNLTGNDLRGAQFAGLINIVQNKTRGFQAAGLINESKSINGIQLAGLANQVAENGRTVQLAGLYNKAANVNTQMAGLINIAKKVTGIQISGLINIADSSDHPVGFINLIKNGEKNIGFSLDEKHNALLSFYSGGKFLYGLIGIGYNRDNGYNFYALQGGLGAHLLQGKYFRTNLEAAQIVQTDFENGHCLTYSLRFLPEIKILQKITFFAGPSLNLQLDYSDNKISSLSGHHFWSTSGKNGHYIGSFVGITGGIKFAL